MTHILYPEYIWQGPFILSVVAVAVNTARRGVYVGMVTGFLGALSTTYAILDGPQSLSIVSLILFVLASALISYQLGKRYDLEAKFRLDIEDRKRIEQELRQAKEAADQSSRVKSAFLANMSHEIRTPLGAILGFSELLVTTDQTSQDRQESLEVITRNGRLLSNIINDILDLTKVESGRLEVERLPVALVPLFEETRSSLSLLAAEKGISLSVSFADHLPDTIITDPLRLKQILINIIGNAIKFTAQGGVHVNVRFRAGQGETDVLVIEVKDSGKGLNEVEIGKLFCAFSQADASTTRKFGGTGLGLVLSRQLARALGGDVQLVESRVADGSLFTVEVDAGLRAWKIPPRPIDRLATSPAIPKEGKLLDGIKVLVVEDARDNQLLMSRILKIDGATFEIAENGVIGVEKALANDFDVVLMDVQMPVMDGFEAMLELRRVGYAKPIIALTAHAMREDRERCLALGFNDHMSKPVDRNKLRDYIIQYASYRQNIAHDFELDSGGRVQPSPPSMSGA